MPRTVKDRRLLMGQLAFVTPLQTYLVEPSGTHLPPWSLIQRQQSPVAFEPTCWGLCSPLLVQLSTLVTDCTRLSLLSRPPRARDCSTKSRAADQEKRPKNVGVAPGFTCWSHPWYSCSSLFAAASSNIAMLMKIFVPSTASPPDST